MIGTYNKQFDYSSPTAAVIACNNDNGRLEPADLRCTKRTIYPNPNETEATFRRRMQQMKWRAKQYTDQLIEVDITIAQDGSISAQVRLLY